MNKLDFIEKDYVSTKIPPIKAGDTIKVHTRIKEGERERIQIYEGVVLRIRGSGTRKSMTVRKVSYGVGVEKVFPMYSPNIAKIEFVSRGKVRQSRIYFMRERFGKKARMEQEMNFSIDAEEKKQSAPKKKSKKAAASAKKSEAAPSAPKEGA